VVIEIRSHSRRHEALIESDIFSDLPMNHDVAQFFLSLVYNWYHKVMPGCQQQQT